MATATENPAVDTATKSAKIESLQKTLAPTSLDAMASESQNLTTSVSTSPPQEKPQPASGDTGEAVNGGLKAKEEKPVGNGVTNDTEKKIRRAERFGVRLQLSEEEKRNSRAERFGTLSGSGALKSPEELKRKARAERFGLVANLTVDNEAKKHSAVDNEAKKHSAVDNEAKKHLAVDNEAKKKARLARFGSNAKIDSQEEAKREARALRFAQSSVDLQTKSDCEGNVEMATQKTAVTSSST